MFRAQLQNFTHNLTDVKYQNIIYGLLIIINSRDKERKMKKQIEQLKRAKNAVILAHYYTPDDIQSIADYVGDSFYLAKIAKQSTADIIVFCGVSFMGESAKILNPDKKVLMPDLSADCPMAHMVKPGVIEQMRERYDDLAVVCYINSTAQLKCQSDVCVTSSNAVNIVKALPNNNIFFIPDRNLGSYVAKQVPGKNIILNDGCCPVHTEVSVEQVQLEKQQHPDALVISHPECEEEILALSDYIGSTAGMIDYAKTSESSEFIVCTEEGVLFQMISDNPDKRFYFPNPHPSCQDMKRNTLERVLSVLENENQIVEIDEDVCHRALIPLERMLELAK